MLGTTEFTLHCGDALISKTSYDPHMVMPAHVHELAYVSVVVDGRYTEHRNDLPRALHRNMLVFHPAGDVHADCVHDCTMATVNIEFRSLNVASLIVAESPAVDALATNLLEALHAEPKRLPAAVAAFERFLRGYAVVKPSPEMLAMRDALHGRDTKRAVSAVAADRNMHRAQLHRIFKRTYGDSPREDIMKKRCAMAAELLTATTTTIAEIAVACGFYDQSQFCHRFKDVTGLSPRNYRRAFARQ